jgi:DNA-binding NtrC family response regulator
MKTILVIDDDPLVGKTVQRMLSIDDWQVRLATDGREALEQISAQAPDLVVTDIIMPNMEGLEIIVALQKSNPQIHIIAVSGSSQLNNVDYLDYAQKLGAYATLTKPFRRDELVSIVRRAFDQPLTERA